jgi:hypothetical protein
MQPGHTAVFLPFGSSNARTTSAFVWTIASGIRVTLVRRVISGITFCGNQQQFEPVWTYYQQLLVCTEWVCGPNERSLASGPVLHFANPEKFHVCLFQSARVQPSRYCVVEPASNPRCAPYDMGQDSTTMLDDSMRLVYLVIRRSLSCM